MIRGLLTTLILLYSSVSYSETGTQTCNDKKMFLRDICKVQELKKDQTVFNECANGFSYEISTGATNDSDFVTTEIQCKMVEIRKQDGIETRTAYFDKSNNKVVVYKHDNGLANAYVYGSMGYYHITQFESGDSIYNYHSFEP